MRQDLSERAAAKSPSMLLTVGVFGFLLFFFHRKSIKKLVLKNLNSSQYSSPISKETDDLASPSEYPQNGHRSEHALLSHGGLVV